MKCDNCEFENKLGSSFCQNCGKPLNKINEVVDEKKVIEKVKVDDVKPSLENQASNDDNNNMVGNENNIIASNNGSETPTVIENNGNVNETNTKKSNKKVIFIVLGIVAGVGLILGILIIILIVFILAFIGSTVNDYDNGSVGAETNTTDNTGNSGNTGYQTRTIMIYMVGSNLESNTGIASAEIKQIDPDKVDLKNNNVLIYTGGTKKWYNFVSNNENAIYELTSDGFKKVKTYSKKNMGDPDTFAEFLNYAYKNYKTDKYDLMFWDHGGAIDGSNYDDFSKDNLTLLDYKEALNKSPFNKYNKLEVIFYRTCLNGTIEVANILKDYSSYLVASEEVSVGNREYPVLGFINDIKPTNSAIDIGKNFIDGYSNTFSRQNHHVVPITYSIIDLNNVSNLNKEIDSFFNYLKLDKYYNDIVKLRASELQFGKTNYGVNEYDMVDLKHLINNIANTTNISDDNFNKEFKNTVIFNVTNLEDAYGLSVYFPYNGKSKTQETFLNNYKKIGLNNSYTTFINNFYTMRKKGKFTSFEGLTIDKENTDIESNNDEKKFSITLTDEQVKDYADSIYIIFRKEDNNKYTPIYSSDNATLSGNTLSTNIKDNLIYAIDKSSGEKYPLTLVDRGYKRNRKLSTTAVTYNLNSDISDIDNWITAANITISLDYAKPLITGIEALDSQNGIGAVSLNLDNINYYEFTMSSYIIQDEKGNYTSNWDNEGITTLFGVKKENLELEKGSLDDNEYYCVFRLVDVYGNSVYSNLISLN